MRLVIPGVPVPAGRARAAVVGGHARVYSPKPNVEYVERVRLAWGYDAMGKTFYRGEPLEMRVAFYMPRLRGHFGTGKNANVLKPSAPIFHMVKPDVDNLVKLLMDGLRNRAFHDDAQVVALSAVKLYADVPRTEVEIRLADAVALGASAEQQLGRADLGGDESAVEPVA